MAAPNVQRGHRAPPAGLVRLAFVSLLPLAACQLFDSPAPLFPFCSDPPLVVPDGGPPLGWADVGPIFLTHCAGCHTAGGIAPFPLESPSDVAAEALAVRAAVVTRLMPPWPLAHCCESYLGDPSLSDAQIGEIASWIDQGLPAGVGSVAEATPPPIPGLARVDLTLSMPEPYLPQPQPGSTDELRCFLVDWPVKTTTYVTAFDVRPSAPSEVHHARAFLMPPGAAPPGSSGADGRPGWNCPNGVPGNVGAVGGWRPGALPETLPGGLGYRVDPGSQIVLSMHYRSATGVLVPDQTEMRFTLEPSVAREAQLVFLADPNWLRGGMPIPAGDPDAAFAWETDPTGQSGGKPISVWAANLHMHEHGKKMIVGVRRKDGSLDCIAEAPAWSYEQVGEDYFLATPMQLSPGDKLHIECHFDNSAGKTALNWGNDQEMCIGYVTATW